MAPISTFAKYANLEMEQSWPYGKPAQDGGAAAQDAGDIREFLHFTFDVSEDRFCFDDTNTAFMPLLDSFDQHYLAVLLQFHLNSAPGPEKLISSTERRDYFLTTSNVDFYGAGEILEVFPVLSKTIDPNDAFFYLSLERLQLFTLNKIAQDKYINYVMKHLWAEVHILKNFNSIHEDLLSRAQLMVSPIMYRQNTNPLLPYDSYLCASYIPTQYYSKMVWLPGCIDGALYYKNYSMMFVPDSYNGGALENQVARISFISDPAAPPVSKLDPVLFDGYVSRPSCDDVFLMLNRPVYPEKLTISSTDIFKRKLRSGRIVKLPRPEEFDDEDNEDSDVAPPQLKKPKFIFKERPAPRQPNVLDPEIAQPADAEIAEPVPHTVAMPLPIPTPTPFVKIAHTPKVSEYLAAEVFHMYRQVKMPSGYMDSNLVWTLIRSSYEFRNPRVIDSKYLARKLYSKILPMANCENNNYEVSSRFLLHSVRGTNYVNTQELMLGRERIYTKEQTAALSTSSLVYVVSAASGECFMELSRTTVKAGYNAVVRRQIGLGANIIFIIPSTVDYKINAPNGCIIVTQGLVNLNIKKSVSMVSEEALNGFSSPRLSCILYRRLVERNSAATLDVFDSLDELAEYKQFSARLDERLIRYHTKFDVEDVRITSLGSHPYVMTTFTLFMHSHGIYVYTLQPTETTQNEVYGMLYMLYVMQNQPVGIQTRRPKPNIQEPTKEDDYIYKTYPLKYTSTVVAIPEDDPYQVVNDETFSCAFPPKSDPVIFNDVTFETEKDIFDRIQLKNTRLANQKCRMENCTCAFEETLVTFLRFRTDNPIRLECTTSNHLRAYAHFNINDHLEICQKWVTTIAPRCLTTE